MACKKIDSKKIKLAVKEENCHSKCDDASCDYEKEAIEIIDIIVDISKVSYKQETDRSSTFLTKSDNLFKYSSTIVTLINTILPLLYINKIIDFITFTIGYINVIPFIFVIYYTIKVQKLSDELYFPTGEKVINEVQKEGINEIIKAKSYYIMCYSSSTKALSDKNSYKAGKLINAYNMYITGIFSMLITIIILLSISYSNNLSQKSSFEKKQEAQNIFEMNLIKINTSLKKE